jgi:hypothetical protein
MSGPGDIDGEVSGDEAAWRDLIAHFDDPAGPELAEAPWPASENVPGPSSETDRKSESGHALRPDAGSGVQDADDGIGRRTGTGPAPASAETTDRGERQHGASNPFLPSDRTRVIRHVGDPRSYSPADEEDERYIPEPLPPPRRLDPVSKGAWVAVIGGPAYLLIVGLFLHWSISAAAAFVAVAAFVGGFVTLVVKLGDHQHRDDDDDGAVL